MEGQSIWIGIDFCKIQIYYPPPQIDPRGIFCKFEIDHSPGGLFGRWLAKGTRQNSKRRDKSQSREMFFVNGSYQGGSTF